MCRSLGLQIGLTALGCQGPVAETLNPKPDASKMHKSR